VFLGRFVGVLRALVPAIAGSAGIPYAKFFVFNATGGITWACGFVLLGAAAGSSYKVVERWAGRATAVLAGVAIFAVCVSLAARWVRDHRELLQRLWSTFLSRPSVMRLRNRYRTQIDFIQARLDPGRRAGLFLTIGLVVAAATSWTFGAILEDALGGNELALIDRPVVRFLALHRDPELTGVMKLVTLLGGTVFVTAVLAIVALIAYIRTRSPRWPAFVSATVIGAVALDNIAKFFVNRPRPDFHPLVHPFGSSFPSGHAVAAAALGGSIAFIVTRTVSWRKAVWVWAIATFVAIIVALSRVYLGAHWPTDVMAGLAMGAFWTAVTATATRYLTSGSPPATKHE